MTPRDRRALIVGAGVAATALLALRGVPWVVGDLQARRQRLVARQVLLARTQAQIRDAEVLGDSAPVIERRLVALAPHLLAGHREADAVADLSGRLSAAAANQRVRVIRTAPVPDTVRVGRLRRVTLQASLEGDARGTLGVLARLERGPAAIAVADLRLTALDPASPVTAPEVIAEDVVIRGWYLTTGLSRGAGP